MSVNRIVTQDSRVSCETLEEAERVAYICAAYQQPCELACDACRRVLRNLIDAHTEAAQVPKLVMLAADRASTLHRPGRDSRSESAEVSATGG
ncbi:MAG: hypothetical protein ACLP0J_19140 [Solirubrobacteraceae bacterium]